MVLLHPIFYLDDSDWKLRNIDKDFRVAES